MRGRKYINFNKCKFRFESDPRYAGKKVLGTFGSKKSCQSNPRYAGKKDQIDQQEKQIE